jgi:hypothetical protein
VGRWGDICLMRVGAGLEREYILKMGAFGEEKSIVDKIVSSNYKVKHHYETNKPSLRSIKRLNRYIY